MTPHKSPASGWFQEHRSLIVVAFLLIVIIVMGGVASALLKMTTLSIAVGPADHPETQFVTTLSNLLQEKNAPIRLRPIAFDSQDKALVDKI